MRISVSRNGNFNASCKESWVCRCPGNKIPWNISMTSNLAISNLDMWVFAGFCRSFFSCVNCLFYSASLCGCLCDRHWAMNTEAIHGLIREIQMDGLFSWMSVSGCFLICLLKIMHKKFGTACHKIFILFSRMTESTTFEWSLMLICIIEYCTYTG